MRKKLFFPAAAVLALFGYLLNQAVRLPADQSSEFDLHLAAIAAGQLCWAGAVGLAVIRSDMYASERLSFDGPAMPIYNTVKWVLVTAFLYFDLFVLNRVWEWYFIR